MTDALHMRTHSLSICLFLFENKILVSKETVVLRRWEIETEIDFIIQVDTGRITTVKDFTVLIRPVLICNHSFTKINFYFHL